MVNINFSAGSQMLLVDLDSSSLVIQLGYRDGGSMAMNMHSSDELGGSALAPVYQGLYGSCKSRYFKTANIKIISVDSKHRS